MTVLLKNEKLLIARIMKIDIKIGNGVAVFKLTTSIQLKLCCLYHQFSIWLNGSFPKVKSSISSRAKFSSGEVLYWLDCLNNTSCGLCSHFSNQCFVISKRIISKHLHRSTIYDMNYSAYENGALRTV
jgi:hypothetical protein